MKITAGIKLYAATRVALSGYHEALVALQECESSVNKAEEKYFKSMEALESYLNRRPRPWIRKKPRPRRVKE